MHLSSLPVTDELRQTSSVTRTEGNNLDVIIQDDAPTGSFDTSLCHMAVWLPFTQGNLKPVKFIYGEAAGIALAAHHLNIGDGSIVSDVDGLNERCRVQFTVELGDTEYEAGTALNAIVAQTNRPREDPTQRRPCAFIGTYRSIISMPTSLFTGITGYAQISGGSTSVELDDVTQYPAYARTIPSDRGNAEPYIQFLYNVLNIRYLTVVNINDAFGNSFVEGMRLARDKHAPGLLINQIPLGEGQQDIIDAVQDIIQSQHKFIYCAIFTAETHDALMTEAYKKGVAGNGYHNWLFADSFQGVLGSRQFEKDSILHKAYQGTGMIEASGGYPGIPKYDLLHEKLRELRDNPDDLEYLGNIFPKHDDEPDYDIYGSPPFIKDPTFLDSISSYTSFLYDATIAMGLAACSAASASIKDNDSLLPSFDGKTHFKYLKQTTFEGVSGTIVFDPITGTRDPSTALYTVTNFVAETVSGEGTPMIRFKKILTAGFTAGKWIQTQPYMFNDGTFDLPADIPPPMVQGNHIHTATRVVSLTLFAIVVILAMGLMIWTRAHDKSRVVRASQPFFLHLICIGVIIVACVIVPATIDESIASTFACTIACNTIPWFWATGLSLVFSAFITKTHRIVTIVKHAKRFKRVKIDVKDVIKPMVGLLIVNLLILSIMTGFSPSRWEETILLYDDFGRPSGTEGSCVFKHQRWYLIVLAILNVSVLFLAIWQAIKARHLSMEFSESRYIKYSMVFLVVVASVGVPVYFMSSHNKNACLFVLTAIIFIGCSSILLFMFVPKMQSLKVKDSLLPTKRSAAGYRMSMSTTSADNPSEAASARDKGSMRILTTKTAAELSQENNHLKRLLRQEILKVEELQKAANINHENGANKKNDEGSDNDGNVISTIDLPPASIAYDSLGKEETSGSDNETISYQKFLRVVQHDSIMPVPEVGINSDSKKGKVEFK